MCQPPRGDVPRACAPRPPAGGSTGVPPAPGSGAPLRRGISAAGAALTLFTKKTSNTAISGFRDEDAVSALVTRTATSRRSGDTGHLGAPIDADGRVDTGVGPDVEDGIP